MSASQAPAAVLRLGTRGSALAMAQTDLVIRRLATRAPAVAAEPVVIRTEGDADKTSPLTVIGGRGVFTSALQEALRRGEIDAAVHSAKDLPSEEPVGLALVAFPERADARDVLVSRHGRSLAELPANPTIGTSSRRRAVQVLARRPDARIVDLRGNVDTRLRKAVETDLDGIVLAAAGVRRMGWSDRITEALPIETFVPSPGQGALAVEARADDALVVALLGEIDDPRVAQAVRIERAFLRAAGGGCTMPIAAHVVAGDNSVRLLAMVASEDGRRVAWADEPVDPSQAEAQAADLVRRMLASVAGPGPFSLSRARERVSGGEGKPLAGLRVLVTRAKAQAAPLSAALRDQGAEPIELPTIRIVDPADPASLDAALQGLAVGGYDWIVLTSANGAERVLNRLAQLGLGRAALATTRVAAVGGTTADRLRAAGVRVDLVPERAAADAVADALVARGVDGQRILYPTSDLAGDALAARLRDAGAAVDVIAAYRTVPEVDVDPVVRARVGRGEADVVTFASPSSVRNLVALLGGVDAIRGAAVVCVGPVTAAAAREQGLPVAAVAPDASVAGLVRTLVARCGTDQAESERNANVMIVTEQTRERGAPERGEW